MRYAIVGAGAAGTAAAKTIRERYRLAEIVVFGEEQAPPYNRYLLTEYLCGSVSEDQLFTPPDRSLDGVGATLRSGERVKRIDGAGRKLELENGETVPYDRLLIATGRRPALNEALRPYAAHIQNYYTIEDARRLKERMPSIRRAVVTGQTVSAFNLLSGLTQLGKDVTYVIKGPRVDIPLVDPEALSDLDAAITDKGIHIVREDRIVAVHPRNDALVVETYQGRELDADVVFVSETYRPNVACARNAGIEMNKGILVDMELHTSLEDVYAAGDCVEIYNPTLRNYWINFGWPNALRQGQIAGANMTGGHESYEISDVIDFDILGKPFRARWWD